MLLRKFSSVGNLSGVLRSMKSPTSTSRLDGVLDFVLKEGKFFNKSPIFQFPSLKTPKFHIFSNKIREFQHFINKKQNVWARSGKSVTIALRRGAWSLVRQILAPPMIIASACFSQCGTCFADKPYGTRCKSVKSVVLALVPVRVDDDVTGMSSSSG